MRRELYSRVLAPILCSLCNVPANACNGMVKELQASWRPLHTHEQQLRARRWLRARWFNIVIVACLVGVAVACTSAIPYRLVGLKDPVVQGKNELPQGKGDVNSLCAVVETDVDYKCPELNIDSGNVPDQASCCALCEKHDNCGAWTWSMSHTMGCKLRGLEQGCQTKTYSSPGVSSGLPHRSLSHPQEGNTSNVSEWKGPQSSLFCFTVALRNDVDMALIEFQKAYKTSIFACDEHALYSNTTLTESTGVNTVVLESDFRTADGKDYGSFHNINVFMSIWRDIIERGRYHRHPWTVKVAVSSVFLPDRLQSVLARYTDDDLQEGVYLNNCDRGLRGGLEVFSRQAVVKWGKGAKKCFSPVTRLWSEDMFIDKCLWKVLHVKRAKAYHTLVDASCHPLYGLLLCRDKRFAAFHPIHDLGAHAQCLLTTTS